jgi:hypothetical protein
VRECHPETYNLFCKTGIEFMDFLSQKKENVSPLIICSIKMVYVSDSGGRDSLRVEEFLLCTMPKMTAGGVSLARIHDAIVFFLSMAKTFIFLFKPYY